MLTQREEKILNFIIREYVKSARPIGSSLLAEKTKFELSPATLRSEMSNLEDKGYLSQLHTSGGRVPTDKAYRHFVNNLVEDNYFEPASEEKRKIRAVLSSTEDPRRLNKNIAQTLSELSDNVVITKISNDPDFYKIGLASLFEFPEFREVNRIFEMTDIFDRFETMFNEIEEIFFSRIDESMKLFIGKENPLNRIKDETMILANYSLPEGLKGSLTMIGPTRMDYEKNISLVKYTTEELNKLSKSI